MLDLVLVEQAARSDAWAGREVSGRSASLSTPSTVAAAEVSILTEGESIAARVRSSSGTASKNAKAWFSQ